VVAGRHQEHRRARELALEARAAQAAGELHGRAGSRRQLGELGGGRSLAGHAQRDARERRRLDRGVDALFGREPGGH
jgi:hypothetical protein